MKDLTTTPTAELLAEWGKLAAIAKHTNYARDATFDKVAFEGNITAIAAELDRRCDEAGLSIIPDKVIFTKGMFAVFSFCVAITPIELRDLLSWLILKGGNG